MGGPGDTAWTGPQWAFVVICLAYGVLFVLFCRLFWWKRQAERRYWRQRPNLSLAAVEQLARQRNEPLPQMTLMVPARNEAAVIEATVEHLASLNYPADRLELIVITDAREDEAAAAEQQRLLPLLAALLRQVSDGAAKRVALDRTSERVLLALLTNLTVAAATPVLREGRSGTDNLFLQLPLERRRWLVTQAAERLLSAPTAAASRAARQLRRHNVSASNAEVEGAIATVLGLALTVRLALCNVLGQPAGVHALRLAGSVARVRKSWTRKFILAVSEAVGADVTRQLQALAAGPQLERSLAEAFRLALPTTRDRLSAAAARLAAAGGPLLRIVTVPTNFDGKLGGRCGARPVPSTKGRALNWGLAYVRPDCAWCGFYDAESRPDRDVLLFMAMRHLQEGATAPQIFQGPVFQVRNFYEMGPLSKVASLYQSVAHEWVLPMLYRRLPFVGGTNLFVRPQLLRQIGGFDATLLTEDLELGTRAYLAADVWPEYLPYAASEQTPPSASGFFRQRLRWGVGHLQVVRKLRRSHEYERRRRRRLIWQLWRKGQCDWVAAQAIALLPPLSLLLYATGSLDPAPFGLGWRVALHGVTAAYFAFTFYAFYRYRRYMDSGGSHNWLGEFGSTLQLCLLPVAAMFFPLPFSSAIVLNLLGAAPRQWFKTPRTPE